MQKKHAICISDSLDKFLFRIAMTWMLVKRKWSHSVVSDSLWPHGLYPTRLLLPWDFPGKILEWVAISFSRRSSLSRDWTRVSCIVGRCFTIWATRNVLQTCMQTECFFPPKFMCWNLVLKEIVLGRGTSGEMLGQEGRTFMNRISVLMKENSKSSLVALVMWSYS